MPHSLVSLAVIATSAIILQGNLEQINASSALAEQLVAESEYVLDKQKALQSNEEAQRQILQSELKSQSLAFDAQFKEDCDDIAKKCATQWSENTCTKQWNRFAADFDTELAAVVADQDKRKQEETEAYIKKAEVVKKEVNDVADKVDQTLNDMVASQFSTETQKTNDSSDDRRKLDSSDDSSDESSDDSSDESSEDSSKNSNFYKGERTRTSSGGSNVNTNSNDKGVSKWQRWANSSGGSSSWSKSSWGRIFSKLATYWEEMKKRKEELEEQLRELAYLISIPLCLEFVGVDQMLTMEQIMELEDHISKAVKHAFSRMGRPVNFLEYYVIDQEVKEPSEWWNEDYRRHLRAHGKDHSMYDRRLERRLRCKNKCASALYTCGALTCSRCPKVSTQTRSDTGNGRNLQNEDITQKTVDRVFEEELLFWVTKNFKDTFEWCREVHQVPCGEDMFDW